MFLSLSQIKTNIHSQAQIFEDLRPLPLNDDQTRKETHYKIRLPHPTSTVSRRPLLRADVRTVSNRLQRPELLSVILLKGLVPRLANLWRDCPT